MPNRIFLSAFVQIITIAALGFDSGALAVPPKPTEPRIVNIYNFCRNSDDRVENSRQVLLQATAEQIKLVHANHLTGTWALQYDALINPDYQKLMHEQLSPEDEVAAWWEIPRQLVEKAGLIWRGRNDWDPTSRIDYSSGYTPDERRKIVDAYMNDFHRIFGHFPRSVGAWYIDEVTLAYMAEKYGIIASCNRSDRIKLGGDPTKFASLWGGYWNQAYYPSRLNAFMPAQTKDGQINVPIFRMLGYDPIYQYGPAQFEYTLEPIFPQAGGSTKWVDAHFRTMIDQPSLAFAYAQVGQENSFGWDLMKQGLTYQLTTLAEKVKTGEIRVETLEKSGEWFRSQYVLTPPTSVVCVDDWRYQGRKSVWYDCRFYRVNFLWDKNGLCIRDLHCFDEKKASPAYQGAMKSSALKCETLPIVEGSLWAPNGQDANAGLQKVGNNDHRAQLQIDGDPVVTQTSSAELKIVQPLKGGGQLTISCAESNLSFNAVDAQRQPFKWGWELHGGAAQAHAIIGTTDRQIQFSISDFSYNLNVQEGTVRSTPDKPILIQSSDAGQLVLRFSE